MIVQVPGSGPTDAKIVLVGEAPGREEAEQGKPFVGSSGRLLNAMLAAAGINRDNVYTTNVVKVRPPDNDLSRLSELNVSIQDYIPLLKEELERLSPHVIIPLGDLAFNTLTGKKPISKWRGSVVRSTLLDGVKVVPTFHPAYVMRDYSMHPVSILDFQRAKEESLDPTFHPFIPKLSLQPTLSEVLNYVEKCHQEKIVSFDVETYGPRIRCLGLACTDETAICIPLKRGPANVWSEYDEHTIWKAVRTLFARDAVTKVGQNVQFDLHFVVPHTGFPRGQLADTMLAHHLLYPELPHDLDFLTSIYTRIGYYGIGNVMRAPDFECWQYNCLDVIATLQVWKALAEDLSKQKMRRFFGGYTMPLLVCLYEMQHRGVHIDASARDEMIKDLKSEAVDLRADLQELAGRELNPNSPKQLQQYFYQEKGYKPQYNRKRHTVTVDHQALSKLSENGCREAGLILQIRAREKLVSTFLDVPLAPDGRMHSEYVISGTVTGRLSSRAPLTGWGMNLQNVDRRVRQVFVPREGHVFVKGDLSQAENRVVAWLTAGRMKRAFERGEDVHVLTADMIGTTRAIAKVINHASNYGMGPGQLATLLNCSMADSRMYINRYHTTYPEVHDWHASVRNRLAKDRTLLTPLGRRRKFFGRWGDELFRAAYSFVPQSTVADYLNLGLLEAWLRLKPLGAAPILNVHDEVVVECRTEVADEVESILKTCLEYPLLIRGSVLVIPFETKILRQNWLQ